MKTTLRTITTKEVEISSETSLAYTYFKRVLNAEKKLALLEERLLQLTREIPAADYANYVQVTDQLTEAFANK